MEQVAEFREEESGDEDDANVEIASEEGEVQVLRANAQAH